MTRAPSSTSWRLPGTRRQPRKRLPSQIYDVRNVARAWVGRPSDIPAAADRSSGPTSFFVAPSPVGLRLVHVEPLLNADGGRMGAVAAEHVLSAGGPTTALTATDYTLQTPLAPVSLRMRWEGAGDESRPGAFILRSNTATPTRRTPASRSTAPGSATYGVTHGTTAADWIGEGLTRQGPHALRRPSDDELARPACAPCSSATTCPGTRRRPTVSPARMASARTRRRAPATTTTPTSTTTSSRCTTG